MAIHAVLFTDAWRYNENNDREVFGRILFPEFWNTKQYKTLKPGDVIEYSPTRWDVEAANPFDAELEVSEDYPFGSNYVTMHDKAKNVFYPMFCSDFVYMTTQTVVDHGRVSGRFGYVKKNKSFGIYWLSAPLNPESLR